MINFEIFSAAIMNIFSNPMILLFVCMGTMMGLIFGSLPGLTSTMGVALLIPLTYTMDATSALGMMIGCYVGGMSGGAISAILLNIPGTPAALCTCFDGYPMAQQGKGAKALGWAAFGSGMGTLFGWLVLVLVSPILAAFCLSFASPEYFALAVFGLTIIAAISGKSITKGIISGLLGVWLSTIGLDPVLGITRFTFGSIDMLGGIQTIPALIGFFSIPQILNTCTAKANKVNVTVKMRDFVPPLKEFWTRKVNIIRSSIIGVIVGMIPATGGNIASLISYDQAKRFSKKPDSFGKGNPDGIIAAESANNGCCGGALVPLITLGIPGDAITAVLLGGLMIHGVTPGPTIFVKHPDIVYGMFISVLLATIFMVLIQCVGIKLFVNILKVPPTLLAPVLVVLSMVGSYALRSNYFDVLVAMVLGLVGYFMTKAEIPMAPVVLGLVLGKMFESEFRRALNVSQGDFTVFFTRPISSAILIVAIVVLLINIRKVIKDSLAGKKRDAEVID